MLVLIPTPIDEKTPLHQSAQKIILDAIKEGHEKNLFVVEDLRPGRRRWISMGLPREVLEYLISYNEHGQKTEAKLLLEELKKGRNIYLMSDGGLPAFCDPGMELVDLCHKNQIKVTATPFCNSISLAIALSGYPHQRFLFAGFLPRKREERVIELKKLKNYQESIVLLDTPYRLTALLEDIKRTIPDREIFLGMDLGSPEELLTRGKAALLLKKFKGQKREYILIIRALAKG